MPLPHQPAETGEPDLFQQALECCHDGITIADARDPDTPLIYVNAGFERITGYLRDEALGRNCRFLQGDETGQPGAKALRYALENGQACVARLRNYRKDGSTFWNEVSLSPMRNAAGELTHFLGVQKDVSNAVYMEEALRKHQQELADANDKLEKLALLDALTGLYNRRYFDREYARSWNNARRDGQPLSVFMIDIDQFKRYNDLYGHPKGDECLRQVAEVISDAFQRGSDFVARYGGEEFVAVARGMLPFDAYRQAKQLLATVRDLNIVHEDSDVAQHVTVSIGLSYAMPDQHADARDAVLEQADVALYQAKNKGRNCIVSLALDGNDDGGRAKGNSD